MVALNAADHGAVVHSPRPTASTWVSGRRRRWSPGSPTISSEASTVRADKERRRLEGSKGFTKDLCARMGIPTAA